LFGHGKKIMQLPPARNLHQSGPEPRHPDPQQKSSRVRELRSFAFPCGNVNADRSLVFAHDGFFRCARLLKSDPSTLTHYQEAFRTVAFAVQAMMRPYSWLPTAKRLEKPQSPLI